MSRSKVWAGSRQQPINASDEALILLLAGELCRRVIGVQRWCNGVNWNAGSIRRSCGGFIAGLPGKALNKVCGENRLVEMDGNQRRSYLPRKMGAKKPFHNPHEIYLAPFGKKMTEKGHNRGIL